jgi:hypothetical protein
MSMKGVKCVSQEAGICLVEQDAEPRIGVMQ